MALSFLDDFTTTPAFPNPRETSASRVHRGPQGRWGRRIRGSRREHEGNEGPDDWSLPLSGGKNRKARETECLKLDITEELTRNIRDLASDNLNSGHYGKHGRGGPLALYSESPCTPPFASANREIYRFLFPTKHHAIMGRRKIER